jgi:hypothetical protein
MSKRHYEWNCGQYVYHVDGQPTTAPVDSIAIAFDKESGTLHKHGSPEKVRVWYVEARNKFVTAGFPDVADDLVVIEGRFPIDEVNKCLDCTGYVGTFYKKLLAGEIDEASFSQFTRPTESAPSNLDTPKG